MALSNTAVPKYYGEFREAVKRGEVPVNKWIELEMNRIDHLIEDPRIYYDGDKVEGYIEFCEQELTLTDGSDLVLLPSFKLWAEEIYGWYFFKERQVYSKRENRYVRKIVKERLTKKQYLIVARGAAKTVYDETIHGYSLICDTDATHQITTAPTMRQAEEVLSPLRTAIARAKGPVIRFLTEGSLQNTTGNRALRQKLAATKKGIENFLTNSLLEVRPMSIDKLQGLRCKVASLDEWLSCDIREDPIGAIEQGASKLDDYLIVATSSEGTVRSGVGDTIKMELESILRGEYYAPQISIFYYRLDDIEEVNHPELWLKANPNLGVTVTYDRYQLDVERAEKVPSTRNDILAKRFGIPTEGYTYFFTYEETLKHRKRYFKGCACALGIDLSQGDDFCAFDFLFPLPNYTFGLKVRSYISSYTFLKLPQAVKKKYQEFIDEGTLVILEGSVLDIMEVYEDLDAFIEENQYDVRCVGFDPYNAEMFIDRWCRENGAFGVEKVRQGSRTESVPLGEIKKLAEERNLLFDEEIMAFNLGNAITLEDTNGNRKLWKRRREDKIDNVAALIDAYVSFKNNRDAF